MIIHTLFVFREKKGDQPILKQYKTKPKLLPKNVQLRSILRSCIHTIYACPRAEKYIPDKKYMYTKLFEILE